MIDLVGKVVTNHYEFAKQIPSTTGTHVNVPAPVQGWLETFGLSQVTGCNF